MRERSAGALALTLAFAACTPAGSADADGSAAPAAPAAQAAPAATVYVARLQPLNTAAVGSETTGEARFTIDGDQLTIRVDVQGAPPNIAHWQHLHGFTDDRTSACPAPAADANGDGFIDLIETEPAAGTTMVPFNDAPVALDIPNESYPSASASGTYDYERTVSLSALNTAVAGAYDGQQLDLERRVVFVHGVPPTTELPASVASLGPIPAHTTLPIACGTIERAQ